METGGNDKLPEMLDRIRLTRLGPERPAGLWITSLPWPRATRRELTLNGQPTYIRPLGQWPDAAEPAPRRLLMAADAEDSSSPATLNIGCGSAQPPCDPPVAEDELFARSSDPHFMWERHRLKISYQGRSLAIAMGLRTGDELRWWEACRLIIHSDTPTCRVVEMAGAIPLHHSERMGEGQKPYENPLLHKHHWLYGHIRVRLHANGVCEVFARHINSKYVDDGGDLAPAVPVIALKTGNPIQQDAGDMCGPWDGSREEFSLGDVELDVREVSRLATPQKPGRMDIEDDMLVWQPYLGCELFGGVCATERLKDGFILRASQQKILRGMARTLRFSFSLSDRPPHVTRYLAPAWWYGLCEEFLPEPLLPVISTPENKLQSGRKWLRIASVSRGFEDGAMARGGRRKKKVAEPTPDDERLEPGWEGEIPYAQFLNAWRYSDAEEYDLAMRSAYHFTDVVVDHAANLVRMHGYPPVAFALPMNRVQGPQAAFLETGDDYLLETAEKVVEGAWRQHKNAWPRLAVGRDACFVRSAVLLYRYFANEHFRHIAYQGALSVAQSQRPNGSFGDQGGGTGIHQWSGYVTKPWMGLLATNGVLDYLELFPDEPALADCVRRFANWLMDERGERNGVLSWGYQHDYNGLRTHQQTAGGDIATLPSSYQWHQETMARLLGYCAIRYNKADYLEAWAESHRASKRYSGDNNTAAAFQFLPLLQAKLFQTTLDKDTGLRVKGVHFGRRTFRNARILTPDGEVPVSWAKGCRLKAPEQIKTLTYSLESKP